jgi:hypothetical protein
MRHGKVVRRSPAEFHHAKRLLESFRLKRSLESDEPKEQSVWMGAERKEGRWGKRSGVTGGAMSGRHCVLSQRPARTWRGTQQCRRASRASRWLARGRRGVSASSRSTGALHKDARFAPVTPEIVKEGPSVRRRNLRADAAPMPCPPPEFSLSLRRRRRGRAGAGFLTLPQALDKRAISVPSPLPGKTLLVAAWLPDVSRVSVNGYAFDIPPGSGQVPLGPRERCGRSVNLPSEMSPSPAVG